MELHHLRRLRRAVPRGHRARRPHHRHAPLPGAHRIRVPAGARGPVQEPREQGQPLGPELQRPHRVDRRDGHRHPGLRRAHRQLRRLRVPLLGRLRRRLRGPRQEDHEGRRRAPRRGRGELPGARTGRDLHRRLGPSCGQRVPVPDAGAAEHRAARRGVRRPPAEPAQDRRDLRPLLQRPRQRVPAGGRRLRGGAPHAAAQQAGPREAARARRSPVGGRDLPRPLLPGPAQPGLRGPA